MITSGINESLAILLAQVELENILSWTWPIGVGLLLCLVVYLYRRRKAQERKLAMAAAAAGLGWTFVPEAPLNFIAGLDRFELFKQGSGKQIENMMYGEVSGVKAAVFDYVYTTGSGDDSKTHYQSIVYLEPANINLPHFSLRPEGFFTKIIQAFGYQDIDFGQRPNFSEQYLLRGQDEPAIRQTFHDGLLSFFESHQGTCVDGGGNQLFIFRAGYRFQPQEIQSQLALALNIFSLLPRY